MTLYYPPVAGGVAAIAALISLKPAGLPEFAKAGIVAIVMIATMLIWIYLPFPDFNGGMMGDMDPNTDWGWSSND